MLSRVINGLAMITLAFFYEWLADDIPSAGVMTYFCAAVAVISLCCPTLIYQTAVIIVVLSGLVVIGFGIYWDRVMSYSNAFRVVIITSIIALAVAIPRLVIEHNRHKDRKVDAIIRRAKRAEMREEARKAQEEAAKAKAARRALSLNSRGSPRAARTRSPSPNRFDVVDFADLEAGYGRPRTLSHDNVMGRTKSRPTSPEPIHIIKPGHPNPIVQVGTYTAPVSPQAPKLMSNVTLQPITHVRVPSPSPQVVQVPQQRAAPVPIGYANINGQAVAVYSGIEDCLH